MRRLTFPLLLLCQQCLARGSRFSIHDDIFAHPQYDVVFSDSFVSEQEAQALVDRAKGSAHATYNPDFSASDLTHNIRAAGSGDDAPEPPEGHDPAFDYEIMRMPPNRYLCSIPVLDDARPENRTAADLAKAEEARETARASQRGWELLAPMYGHCLHFMSGWWSYRFCFGKNIVQYHALPQVPNGMPPVQDPDTLAFMLGRAPTPEEAGAGHAGRDQQAAPPNTELQVKGDQRYLVQRLGGGTTCDLTGRERTIEVQYHCAPGANMDRIGYIKEVTTCAYLMVINTPRLCDDVAFLPPREISANPITCRPISADGSGKPHEGRTLGERETPSGQVLGSTSLVHPPVVGGVVVGGHNILAGADDESPFNLDQRYLPNARGGGKIPSHAESSSEVVASGKSKQDGGGMSELTDEELEERDMDPEFVRGLVDELRDLAGDRGWKLEVVEEPGRDRELRGTVDVEEGENLGTLVQERDAEEGDEEDTGKGKTGGQLDPEHVQ